GRGAPGARARGRRAVRCHERTGHVPGPVHGGVTRNLPLSQRSHLTVGETASHLQSLATLHRAILPQKLALEVADVLASSTSTNNVVASEPDLVPPRSTAIAVRPERASDAQDTRHPHWHDHRRPRLQHGGDRHHRCAHHYEGPPWQVSQGGTC